MCFQITSLCGVSINPCLLFLLIIEYPRNRSRSLPHRKLHNRSRRVYTKLRQWRLFHFVQTPRLWREPRERIPLTCSLLIVWMNHIVGYLSVSASESVLQRPIIYTQFEAFCATFSRKSSTRLLSKRPPSIAGERVAEYLRRSLVPLKPHAADRLYRNRRYKRVPPEFLA